MKAQILRDQGVGEEPQQNSLEVRRRAVGTVSHTESHGGGDTLHLTGDTCTCCLQSSKELESSFVHSGKYKINLEPLKII